MATYTVHFIQEYTYEVEAKDVDEVIENAEEEFSFDMCSPVANTVWDEMIVEDENGEEIEHGYN